MCARNHSPAANESTRRTAQGQPHPAPAAGQVLSVTIKDLGNFDYDQDKVAAHDSRRM